MMRSSLRVISCSCRRPCKSSTDHPRSGYILVFFAMILFGIMALAALVIDIGFARLTQRQMQTAVDAAAIEGLRWRGVQTWEDVPQAWLMDPQFVDLFPGVTFAGPIDATSGHRETIRRWAASRTVALVFDDDLNTVNGDDGAFYDDLNPDPNAGQQFNVAGKFGAGPVLEFTGGEGSDPDLAASQFINDPDNPNSNPDIGSYPSTPVHKPNRSDGTRGLEFNIGDELHGDMVAGEYFADEDRDDEDENYDRSDFSAGSSVDSAFLVRMRRTNNFDGLDADPGISTHGPPLPFLFGRGSLAVRDLDMVSDYLPRRHGITVRGTGIADALPAMSVGLPDPTIMLPGLARFGLSRSEAWDRLIVDDPVTWSLSNGVISNPHGGVVGRFFSFGAIESMPVSIGREVPPESSLIDGTYTGYLPIYDEVDSVDRVVAFGIATAQVSSAGATVTITREPARIASTNASAVLCYPRPAGTSVDEWRSILDRILPVDASVGDVLLAPVSVR